MPELSTAKKSEADRRCHPRMAVHWSGCLHGSEGPSECLILDFSDSGAQVQCADPMAEISEVTLELGHGGEHRGSVVWQKGSFMGLHFLRA